MTKQMTIVVIGSLRVKLRSWNIFSMGLDTLSKYFNIFAKGDNSQGKQILSF